MRVARRLLIPPPSSVGLDELINGLRTDIRISPQQLVERPSLSLFNTRETKCAVILEILTLAYGDNMLPDAETKMVQRLASDLGFSKTEYEAMKAWGERSRSLLDDALAMMAGRSGPDPNWQSISGV